MKKLFLGLVAVGLLAACQSAPSRKIDATMDVKPGVSEISPAEAAPRVAAAYSQFIDVRTAEEYRSGHASRARNIPLDELMQDLGRLEKNEPVYLICQTGIRSMKAVQMLSEAGFPQTVSIAGGTTAWQEAGLPMVK